MERRTERRGGGREERKAGSGWVFKGEGPGTK